MDEKRRHPRIIVKGVHGDMFFTTHVEIINISLGGASIQLNKSLIIGKDYTIKLDNKGKPLELKGTVMWSVLVDSQKGPHGDVIPLYHVGLKFSDILSNKTAELIDFIEGHKDKTSEEKLRGLRFRIHTPQNTVLFYPSVYKVKLISPFGMLMETMQAFNPEDRLPMEMFLKDGKVVRFLGRIVSCTEIKGNLPKSYDIGVEFLEMYPEDRENLKEFIGSLIF